MGKLVPATVCYLVSGNCMYFLSCKPNYFAVKTKCEYFCACTLIHPAHAPVGGIARGRDALQHPLSDGEPWFQAGLCHPVCHRSLGYSGRFLLPVPAELSAGCAGVLPCTAQGMFCPNPCCFGAEIPILRALMNNFGGFFFFRVGSCGEAEQVSEGGSHL